MHPQLPFEFELQGALTFESFWPGENALPLDVATRLAGDANGDLQVYLWGPPDTGKTHLLSATCNHAIKSGFRIAYFSAELISSADALSGYESFDIVCIDDLHLLPGGKAGEMALFNLINAMRAKRGRLLLAANCLQPDLGIELPDLQTRLSWGATYALTPIVAAGLSEALLFRAGHMGLMITEDVVQYLLNHYSRDFNSMLNRLRELDRASLQTQRKITIPFARQVLSGSTDN